jgi:ferric-dicitrate binding protein FerR (iron transport regulator)
MTKFSPTPIAIASLAVLLALPALTAQSGEQAAQLGQQAAQSGEQSAPSAGQTAQPGVQAAQPVQQAAASTAVSAAAYPGASKVRIVRLSEVKGQAQMDRGVGRGFEPAIANLPIVENCRLQTGNGVAEVEFEDNSSLRLAPDSEVDFPTLERLASGATVSSVRLVKGMAYVSLMKTPGNRFDILFGQQSLALPPSSHVRLQLEGTDAKLAVLDGAVQIKNSDGVEDVPHKRTITFAMAGSSEPTVAKSVDTNPFDAWDHNADEYHARQATMSAFNNTPYTYGLSDMTYYGDFADIGGCGMMWRPYFASVAWDPYANGAWAWYGGVGYSWVSPYPWGWTPYHYGMWSFCPGTGWGWMPGGSWMGLNNTAAFAGLKGPIIVPKVPSRAPRIGEPGLLAVNQRPLVRSQVGSSNSFVFRKDSAGLGVPRDELGKLNKFSEQAVSRGAASTHVYMQAPVSAGANGRATYAGVPSMRRGSPPPAETPRAEMGGQGRMSTSGSNAASSGSNARVSSPSMSSASSGGHASAPSSSGRSR